MTVDDLLNRLTLPVIAAPMFMVSAPELVIAAACSGIVGAFPTANARSGAELSAWLTRIAAQRDPARGAVAANVIVHRSNSRLAEDLAVLCEQPTELVITSVGSPAPVIDALHAAGSLVFSDIASVRHARRAIDAGVDGLILLTAGSGGQTGWANPFAFVRAVREFYDGPVVLAGGISDGVALRAARTLGADLAYLGTRFLATVESLAAPAHKQMIVDSEFDDIVLTSAFTGLPTSMLRASIERAGIDLTALHAGGVDISALLAQADSPSPWLNFYSAGHSTSGVHEISTVAEVVEQVAKQYRAAASAVV
ncbi:NAD(P)H-dependent flavin oxidoreductase [Nocardia huaxiensis]|uniref:Nitronate monooxygenase n=1 Tax=Nocardia huaxiensis TaxID=2755382 RepID=A0A7D6ZNR3_9NOCA|nr:nitronate monooxygenase [Nocardia huaxiensis]QLY29885.1 nitronate monooxygenase [Nocardia huaxiensis]UFS96526.1 nitronate monooxygenase [Nocardia huaxiensis]